MNLFFRTVIAISVLALSSCAHPIVDLTGEINGTVTDYATGEFVHNCAVGLSSDGHSTSTNSNGQFSFKSINPGTYSLSFSKTGYEDATRSVTVTSGKILDLAITLNPLRPEVKISDNKLDFGNEVTVLSFDISNSGKGTLEWSLSENAEWLSCAPADGTLPAGKSASVVATIIRDGLKKGNYTENIVISTNAGSFMISVVMSVDDFALTFTPESLDFGSTESSKEVTVTNPTGRTVKYTIDSSNGWLTVSKKESNITKSDNFKAIVSRDGLSAGSYSGSITITVGNDIFSIPVTMSVAVKEKPEVTIESVSDITFNSANAKAVLKSTGSSKVTRYGFCWSKNSSPTVEDYITNYGDCTDAKSFEGVLPELESDTRYYVRAYAENNEGLVYSSTTLNFITSPKPIAPTVKTSKVADITPTSAVIEGELVSLGNVKEVSAYGHVWSTNQKPVITSGHCTNLGASASCKSFSSSLTSLSPCTTYYVRAYATNSEGTSYGEEVTFKTSDYDLPSVTTGQASNVKATSFNITGNLASTGGINVTSYGHCWSTSENPTVNGNKTELGSSDTEKSFESTISGLQECTTYYVRSYATNSKGTSYGSQISVTTTEAETEIWDGKIATEFAGGNGTRVSPYIIKTGGQLLLMKEYSDKCFVLANNINLNNHNWLPFVFIGNLDGKGYTISHLCISRTTDEQGLFSSLKGVISNLTIKSVNISASDNYCIGAFCGSLRSGELSNCHLILDDKSIIQGKTTVGGLAGRAERSSITNCSVVSNSNTIGIYGDYSVGGLLGWGMERTASSISIKSCIAKVNIAGSDAVGGIIGSGALYMENCSFTGTLESDLAVGGLIGYGNGEIILLACCSNINILSGYDAGGLIGTYGGESPIITCCYSAGTIKEKGGVFVGDTNLALPGVKATLSYSTVQCQYGLGMYDRITGCVTVTSCTDINKYLQECYSPYAEYWNFDNTWTWEGVINGKTVKVPCPKLYWEQ